MNNTETKIRRVRGRGMGDIRPSVEKMSEAHKHIVAPRSGRPKKQSIFFAEIGAAIGTDEAYKIDIPEGMKAATIVSELHKAAKEHSVRLKVWKRDVISEEDAALGVKPFVGFQVMAKELPATGTAALPIIKSLDAA